ncbi:hypothetical protein ACF1HJ_32885 [Streptomyces sp. NPDC013978]|uniref:hypothetical protein n=1 Tax=Streptomyces sp. NPDC013978 TaxID=3364869 RepID=UPI0037031B4E
MEWSYIPFVAEITPKMKVFISKEREYAIPFPGVGGGFSPRDVAALLVQFSSTPWELYRLVTSVMELDESGEVREAVTADLIEWHESEAVDV